ncbi:phosphatidylglycerol lysyltransferase [Tistlia consotensis]|uniref:Phosphatidylglycerol lysyltransferase n=1 Tax=Tistlia consotensis USBA 355 TaxID=560819 RepID=A0A1Y6CK70_9PROT|nr:bifunctional lysylphosphatidylglycerol flippase/synthetase MprF [Tistlia consotensis]SMF70524.1 phosphatidylglycerol lysyltransferase [Tistlia consotensis USBA 355]SNS04966.1 phosphatidylglycerol lysyltransferase [Tistlia consotensis]
MPPSLLQRLRTVLPFLIGAVTLGAAIWLLHGVFAHFRYHQLARELGRMSAHQLTFATGLSLLSYFALTGYDYWGLRHIGQALPYRRVAAVSFIAQSVAHSTGFAGLIGGGIRYRLYAAEGLSLADVVKVQLFFGVTFGLGLGTMIGGVLVIEPGIAAGLASLSEGAWRAIGGALLAAVLAYLIWSDRTRRELRLFGHSFPPTPLGLTTIQIVLAIVDIGAAAGCLWLLLPAGLHVSYPLLLGIFVLSTIAGVISHVPGGLGVFDGAVLLLLSPADQQLTAVVGALIAYRGVYYLLPLTLGGLLLMVFELRRAFGQALLPLADAGRLLSSLAPSVAATLVFVAGLVLLASGATPAIHSRMAELARLVPEALIETSHLLGSLIGVGLLILARGLARRLRLAWRLTLVLLPVGAAASLLKGFDWEEATVLALFLLLLAPCGREFYRRASLLDERFGWRWTLAVVAGLLATLWLLLFAFRHIEYADQLWWQVALHADAPRALRATLAATVVALLFAGWHLLRPSRALPSLAGAAELAEAERIVRDSPSAAAHLALTGDKALLFDRGRQAFVMYAVHGRSWIAMGPPVGPRELWPELLWDFRDLVDRNAGRAVFYEVSARDLPPLLDLGLHPSKFGEIAYIDLAGFSLAGRRRADLRNARSRAEREGTTFEVLEGERLVAALPELRLVSDQWLVERGTREKRFSLGFFDEGYLARTPVAVARNEGRIVAFANLWLAGGRQQVSIDLMRYGSAAPNCTMDFLFAEILLWAQQQGYRRFSLGMAVLSGLPAHRLAPLWSQVAGSIARHGARFYNFAGLRAYKEKFDPDWESVYVLTPSLGLAPALADAAALIAGGWSGLARR